MIVYVGATSADLVATGALYRVTFQNSANPLTLAFWDRWEVTVQRFVDRLPGSGYGAVIGTPALLSSPTVPVSQETAVCVIRVASTASSGVGGTLSLGAWLRKIGESFPGADITRAAYITGAMLSGTDSELALDASGKLAAERNPTLADRVKEFFDKLGDSLKKAGVAALIIGVIILLLYAAIVRGRLTARRS